jgi:hypothetical protein
MTVKIPDAQPSPGATGEGSNGQGPEVKITPYVARQNVNRFVIMEITTQMGSEEPTLIAGERPCWSVPVVLTSPRQGTVGKVGEVLVDATTGELLVDDAFVHRMREDARHLADRCPL